MKKSFLTLSTLSLVAAFGLAACGDDSSSGSSPSSDNYKSIDAAPECDDDLDGEVIFVGSKNTEYVCNAEEGVWVKKSAKSSSSSAKAKSSSSSAKAKSSSSEAEEVPEFYKTLEDLPKCSSKTEGDTLLVGKTKDSAVEYVCHNGEWAKADVEEATLSEGSMPNGLVIIGSQVWQGQNMNDSTKGGACYNNEEENCETFGRLYTWAEAMGKDLSYNDKAVGAIKKNFQGICPDGFHIPTGTDWDNLRKYVNSTKRAAEIRKANDYYENEDVSGIMLRGTTYDGNDMPIWSTNGGVQAEDTYGFMVVGAGYGELSYDYNEETGENDIPVFNYFNNLLEGSYFWIAAEESGYEDTHAYHASFSIESSSFDTTTDRKTSTYSVRCLMNTSADEYMKTDEYKKMTEESKKAKK